MSQGSKPYCIDRINGGIAVLEPIDDNSDDGCVPLKMNAADLHEGAKEGDIVVLEDETLTFLYFDEEHTKSRKESIAARFERLKRRGK